MRNPIPFGLYTSVPNCCLDLIYKETFFSVPRYSWKALPFLILGLLVPGLFLPLGSWLLVLGSKG